MAAFGIAWASIIAMPYAILSISLPSERMGVYMGIFNFFIVLPQIAYSLFMPFIIKNVFHEDALKTIILGSRVLFDRRHSCNARRGSRACSDNRTDNPIAASRQKAGLGSAKEINAHYSQ